MAATVMIDDDHAVFRTGLRSLLELSDELEVVAEAENGEKALELTRSLRPDLILMDLVMPGIGGVAAIRAILAERPETHIAVLTSTDDDKLAFDALEAGTRSFLLKSMFGDELLSAMVRAAQGENVIHPTVAVRILKVVRRGFEPVPTPFSALTNRELEVLREPARGGSNVAIAERLYISEKTVKTHISNILGKLELGDRTAAVAFAWREGLLKPRDSD
jgi:DNA-binding NarL/FixJ family response regulator